MKSKLYAPFFMLILLYSCSGENAQNLNNKQNIQYDKTPVETVIAEEQNFYKELYTNGVIKSSETAELKFKTAGQITEFYIREGQSVKKGDILAVLDLRDKKTEYQKAKINLSKAQNNYESLLLGHGYEISDSTNIPSEILEKAKIKSSLSTERLNLKKAELELQSSYLKAPFSGLIANVEKKKYAYISSGDVICTLINHSKYELTFPVFETDLNQISLNKKAEIITLENDTVSARISQINPVVTKGQCNVTARITQTSSKLMAGMNVKVTVKNPIGRKLVVPRSAVVTRQNREVVFTVKNGKAVWNYVTAGPENKNQIVIEDGLNVGDSVIISNNISIAHDTEVKAEKPDENK